MPAAVNGLVRRSPPKENGVEHLGHKKDAVSPQSAHSSAPSTPAPAPKKNGDDAKPPTPKSSGHRSPPGSVESGSPTLKSGLPGPPYGLGFPPPPGLPTNGSSAPPPPEAAPYRAPYDAHPAMRGQPALGLAGPPGGKPYVRHLLHQSSLGIALSAAATAETTEAK
jgi:hypothetical protein